MALCIYHSQHIVGGFHNIHLQGQAIYNEQLSAHLKHLEGPDV